MALYVNPATGKMTTTQTAGYVPLSTYNPGTGESNYNPNTGQVEASPTPVSVGDQERLASNTNDKAQQDAIARAQGTMGNLGNMGSPPAYQAPDYSQYQPSLASYEMPDYSQYQPNLPQYQPPDYSSTAYGPTPYNAPDMQSVYDQHGVTDAQSAYDAASKRHQEAQTAGFMLPQQTKDMLKDSSWALGLSKDELLQRLSDPNSPTYIENPFTRQGVIQQAQAAQKATISDMLDKVTAIYQTVLSASQFATESRQKELARISDFAQEAYKDLQWFAREQYSEQVGQKQDIAAQQRSDISYGARQDYENQVGQAQDLSGMQMSDAQWGARTGYGVQTDQAQGLADRQMDDAQWAARSGYGLEEDIYHKEYDALSDVTKEKGQELEQKIANIPFKAGLRVDQQNSIRELLKKRPDPGQWNEIDWKNWNYATDNANPYQIGGTGQADTGVKTTFETAGGRNWMITYDGMGNILKKEDLGAAYKESSGGGSGGGSGGTTYTLAKNFYSKADLDKGAASAGMTIAEFGNLPLEEARQYVNTPDSKTVNWYVDEIENLNETYVTPSTGAIKNVPAEHKIAVINELNRRKQEAMANQPQERGFLDKLGSYYANWPYGSWGE